MVLLRHTLPDASWHFDWLIQRDDPRAAEAATASGDDAKVLCAFRTLVHPATPATIMPGSDGFDALALPDHRRLYLQFEGPIAMAPRPERASESLLAAGALEVESGGGERSAPSFPLTDNRGSVVRVAFGWARWLLASPDAITLVGSLGEGAVQTWRGRRVAGDQWRFSAGPATHSGSAEG